MAIRKVLILLFCIQFISPELLIEFTRIPRLFIHYFHHNEQPGLVDFFNSHYGGQNSENHDHCPLPFQHGFSFLYIHIDCIESNYCLEKLKINFCEYLNKISERSDFAYDSLSHSDIWQPPKQRA